MFVKMFERFKFTFERNRAPADLENCINWSSMYTVHYISSFRQETMKEIPNLIIVRRFACRIQVTFRCSLNNVTVQDIYVIY